MGYEAVGEGPNIRVWVSLNSERYRDRKKIQQQALETMTKMKQLKAGDEERLIQAIS